MARRILGGQAAVAATASQVSTILSITGNKHFAKVVVRLASGAANNGYIGNSDVANTPANAHVELAAGESYTFGGDGLGHYSIDDIYLVGTVDAANIWFISLEE